MSRWAGVVNRFLPDGLPDLRAVDSAGGPGVAADNVEGQAGRVRSERLWREHDDRAREAHRAFGRMEWEAARSERERRFRNGEQLYP